MSQNSRGECAGSSGIFPSSFVRIIDSFPGDIPTADISSYRGAESHQGHEYDNTQPAFKGLDEGLKAAFCTAPRTQQNSLLSHGARLEAMLENSLQPDKKCEDTAVGPDTFLRGDYFRQNLPTSFIKPSQPLSLQTEDCAALPQVSAHAYSNLSSSLSALKPVSQTSIAPHPHHSGYKNLAESLTSAMKTPKSCDTEQPCDTNVFSSNKHRYQNAQFGYNGQSVDVRPYAISIYNFVPQFENELGFNEGDMVFLLRHVDNDWSEGEMDGQRGIFPRSYINIIVDCSHKQELGDLEFLSFEQPETQQTGLYLQPSAYYRVAFSFSAETETDLSLCAGDLVRIISQNDQHWCFVENSSGEVGQCPVNHLDTCEENISTSNTSFAFDVEELIGEARVSCQVAKSLTKNAPQPHQPKINPSLKFFDPLCSPDEEMLQIETELIRKVNEKPSIPVNPDVALHTNINLDPLNEERPRHRFKSSTMGKEQSIDSFITQNLDGLKEIRGKSQTLPASFVPSSHHLASLVPFISDCSPPTKQRQTFQISASVREELLDKKKLVAPPRPTEGPQIKNPHSNQTEFVNLLNEMYENPDSAEKFLPMSNLSQENSLFEESKPVITSNFDQTPRSTESLYAKVNKNCIKRMKNKADMSGSYPDMDPSCPASLSEEKKINIGIPPSSLSLDRLDLSYDELRPVVPPRIVRQISVPSPHLVGYPDPMSSTSEAVVESHVPKATQSNNGAVIATDSSCIIYEELPADVSHTVTVEINYNPTENDVNATSKDANPDVPHLSPSIYDYKKLPSPSPSNQNSQDAKTSQINSPVDSACVSPIIPKRTTSIFQRFQSAFGRGETFKSYIAEFPPDKEAILSPDDEYNHRELPPRPLTTPLKTRSVFYNSVMSDRSTPSLPSLSHSYETLNGSDTVDINYRTPHRPAPPGQLQYYI